MFQDLKFRRMSFYASLSNIEVWPSFDHVPTPVSAVVEEL